MLEPNSLLSRIAAVVEEELGNVRAFADLPATELEAIATRLVRVLAPFIEADQGNTRQDAA